METWLRRRPRLAPGLSPWSSPVASREKRTQLSPRSPSDVSVLSCHRRNSRRRSRARPRSRPLPGGPPRVLSPASFPSESGTHPRVRFSRDEGDRGCVDPDGSRPPWSVFHDSEFHESRRTDCLQVFGSDHRVSHAAAIVFDGSQVPFLDDVRDDESSAWLENPKRLCKYGRLVGAQIDDAVTQDHVGLCVAEEESCDSREDARGVPDTVGRGSDLAAGY